MCRANCPWRHNCSDDHSAGEMRTATEALPLETCPRLRKLLLDHAVTVAPTAAISAWPDIAAHASQ